MNRNVVVKGLGVAFLFAGLALVPLGASGQEPSNQQPTWQLCEPGQVIGEDVLALWGVRPQDLAGFGLQNEYGQFVCPADGRFPVGFDPSSTVDPWGRLRRDIGNWAGTIIGPLNPAPPPPVEESGPEDPPSGPSDPGGPPSPPPTGYAVPGGR